MHIGWGVDVHKLVEGRPLVLGGVAVPFDKGLEGHSDADVLIHAICDALLGAAALGDIGMHFPDSDPAYKGIASTVLLKETGEKVARAGYDIINIDATLMAQAPKIGPYREEMVSVISKVLGLSPGQVNVKATTAEGLGFTGRQEGMAAMCAASLNPRAPKEEI